MKKLILAVVVFSVLSSLSAVAQQALSGTGTINFIPKWTSGTAIGNSIIFQSTGGNVGIGSITPGAKLDVKGTSFLRGAVTLFPTTTTALGVSGTAFRLDNLGKLNFVAGQTFPGAGTITGVVAGTGLTGGGGSGNVGLSLNTGFTDGRYAQLAASNTFGPDQSFSSRVIANGDLIAGGGVFVSGDVSTPAAVRGTFGVFTRAFVGTSSSTGQSILLDNTGGAQTVQIQNHSLPIGGFIEAQFDGNTKATFYTDSFGNTVATGTKSAAVPLTNGNMVKVFSMESPEVWFEDFGAGQLGSGITTVKLDAAFVQTVGLAKGYHVFVTPNGDCNGLYVTNQTSTGFEVRELNGGRSNVPFDYRIVGHRKGFEATRMPAATMPTAVAPSAPVAPAASIPAAVPAQRQGR